MAPSHDLIGDGRKSIMAVCDPPAPTSSRLTRNARWILLGRGGCRWTTLDCDRRQSACQSWAFASDVGIVGPAVWNPRRGTVHGEVQSAGVFSEKVMKSAANPGSCERPRRPHARLNARNSWPRRGVSSRALKKRQAATGPDRPERCARSARRLIRAGDLQTR